MVGDFGTLVIAVAALVVSVWSVLFRSRRRDFEILLDRSDKEAAKREAETRELRRQLERAAAQRETETRDLRRQLEKEAAQREAGTRDLMRQLEKEAAKRQAGTKDLMRQLDNDAAKREAETREFRRQLSEEAAKREAAIQRMLDISERRFSALMERLDDHLEHLAAVSERVAQNETALRGAKTDGYRTVAAQASAPDESDEEAVQQAPPDQLAE